MNNWPTGYNAEQGLSTTQFGNPKPIQPRGAYSIGPNQETVYAEDIIPRKNRSLLTSIFPFVSVVYDYISAEQKYNVFLYGDNKPTRKALFEISQNNYFPVYVENQRLEPAKIWAFKDNHIDRTTSLLIDEVIDGQQILSATPVPFGTRRIDRSYQQMQYDPYSLPILFILWRHIPPTTSSLSSQKYIEEIFDRDSTIYFYFTETVSNARYSTALDGPAGTPTRTGEIYYQLSNGVNTALNIGSITDYGQLALNPTATDRRQIVTGFNADSNPIYGNLSNSGYYALDGIQINYGTPPICSNAPSRDYFAGSSYLNLNNIAIRPVSLNNTHNHFNQSAVSGNPGSFKLKNYVTNVNAPSDSDFEAWLQLPDSPRPPIITNLISYTGHYTANEDSIVNFTTKSKQLVKKEIKTLEGSYSMTNKFDMAVTATASANMRWYTSGFFVDRYSDALNRTAIVDDCSRNGEFLLNYTQPFFITPSIIANYSIIVSHEYQGNGASTGPQKISEDVYVNIPVGSSSSVWEVLRSHIGYLMDIKFFTPGQSNGPNTTWSSTQTDIKTENKPEAVLWGETTGFYKITNSVTTSNYTYTSNWGATTLSTVNVLNCNRTFVETIKYYYEEQELSSPGGFLVREFNIPQFNSTTVSLTPIADQSAIIEDKLVGFTAQKRIETLETSTASFTFSLNQFNYFYDWTAKIEGTLILIFTGPGYRTHIGSGWVRRRAEMQSTYENNNFRALHMADEHYLVWIEDGVTFRRKCQIVPDWQIFFNGQSNILEPLLSLEGFRNGDYFHRNAFNTVHNSTTYKLNGVVANFIDEPIAVKFDTFARADKAVLYNANDHKMAMYLLFESYAIKELYIEKGRPVFYAWLPANPSENILLKPASQGMEVFELGEDGLFIRKKPIIGKVRGIAEDTLSGYYDTFDISFHPKK